MRLLILFTALSCMSYSVAGDFPSTLSGGKYYTGFEAGYSYAFSPNKDRFNDETTKDSAQVGMVLGRYFDHNIRVELEGNYKTKSIAESPSGGNKREQTFESAVGLVNIYKSWNYKESETIQPFIMAGVGASYNIVGDYKVFNGSNVLSSYMKGKKNIALAYQIGAGISLQMNRDAYLDFSARYINRGDANTTSRNIAVGGSETVGTALKAVVKDVVGLVSIRLNI